MGLEDRLWQYTNKMGTFGCFEVTIGFFDKYELGRVDYLTYDTKGIWKCYEIKVSKSDFYSKSKWTFVGHYNYFIMTEDLYEQVKHDVSDYVGVHTGYKSLKQAKKQNLIVDEEVLKDSMIRSLSREVQKNFNKKIKKANK